MRPGLRSGTAGNGEDVPRRHPELRPAVPLDRDTVCRYMGLTNEELAGIFFPSLPYETAFSLMEESCALENEWLPVRGGILWPGVEDTLVQLKTEGYRLFVVSNAQDGYVEGFGNVFVEDFKVKVAKGEPLVASGIDGLTFRNVVFNGGKQPDGKVKAAPGSSSPLVRNPPVTWECLN